MNRAQAYLAKTLPVVPPVPDEIEEPQSAGAAIADAAARFLGRHLACEPRQHTVLALWVIYAWCFKHISTAVYLAVLRAFFAGISRLSRDENSIRNGMGNRNSDFSMTCADVRIEALFLYAPKKNTNRWVVYMESVSSASGKRHFLRALRTSGCAPAFGRVEVKSFVAYPALSDSATQRTRGGVARDGLLSSVPLKRDWVRRWFESVATFVSLHESASRLSAILGRAAKRRPYSVAPHYHGQKSSFLARIFSGQQLLKNQRISA